MAETLTQLQSVPFHLSRFEGGSLRNAIPREACAVFTCPIQYKETLDCFIASMQTDLQNRYHSVEDNLQLTIKACSLPNTVLTPQSQNSLLDGLKDCPNGVFAMDVNLPEVVQTSSNLGVLTQNGSTFTMEMLVRSQVETEKSQYAEKIEKYFQQFGGTCRREGNYPGWKPNPDSTVYKMVQEEYNKLFHELPKTMVIHAGLECGLFSNKYPHWDMISFGPTIKFPHSPDEKVHIPSVDKYWQLLVATLEALCD